MANSQNHQDSSHRHTSKIKTHWDLEKLGEEPGDLKTNLAPVLAYLERKFADWDYSITPEDYRFRLDEENDKLTLWVEREDILDTSPTPLEIEYSFLMEGGFLAPEAGPALKSLGQVFDLWIPLIREARKKRG
jgi:hypothetical protein